MRRVNIHLELVIPSHSWWNDSYILMFVKTLLNRFICRAAGEEFGVEKIEIV